MKRKRETRRERLPPIGASEFALVVNQQGAAQDPVILLGALQRFVRTIQRDRKMAAAEEKYVDDFSCADDDSEEDSSIDSISDSCAKKRRYKKDEVWKEDSAKYNVPFVGTAVASKGADPVIQGEWPTGLLKTYLTKSPLAVELTSDTLSPTGKDSDVHKRLLRTQTGSKEQQRKNRKLSEAIHRAYLKALAELCTAAIPRDKSEKDDREDEPRFVFELLTKRVPHLLNLLGEETNNGKGKAAIAGGCGPLVAPVIQILERLTLVSSRTARHVVRCVEQSLPDGVMRFLLAHRQPQRQMQESLHTEKDIGGGGGDEGGNTMNSKWSPREKAQVAALHLTATLAEMNDSVVFSCISTSGVKERKIRPGLLFLALQRGLPIGEIENPRHIRVAARLLLAVRELLERHTIAKRSLVDLFSRDFVQKLIQFSMMAPPLSFRMGCFNVLAGTDTYENDDNEIDNDKVSIGGVASDEANRHQLAIEARRLLFVLLGDTERSPLLHSLLTNRSNMAVQQLVARALVKLLDCTTDPDHEIRRFVVHVANLVPILFPSIMRNISLPEPRRPFAFAAQLHCLSALLSEGPSAVECFAVDDTNGSVLLQQNDEAIMMSILPVALKRQIFAKAFQSKNHLVALMSLKLFLVVLERCRIFLVDLADKEEEPGELVPLVTKRLTGGIPDATMLLMTLPRFDFGERAGAVLFGHACEAIRAFAEVFKSHADSTTVDWTKLLPSDPLAFCRAPLLLQKMVLSSVRSTVTSQKTHSNFHSSSFESLIGIVVGARSSHIYQYSRSIAVDLLCRLSPKAGSEDALELRTIREYEASCWVDGLTGTTVGDFCWLIEKTVSASLPSFVAFLRAWRSAGLPAKSIPNTQPSSILFQALGMLNKTSHAFSQLIVQVASKCLLFDINPIPIAALVLDAALEPKTQSLASYARSLIYYDEYSATKKVSLVMEMLADVFSKSSVPLNLFPTCRSAFASPAPLLAPNVQAFARLDALALTQQFLHLATISREGGQFSFDVLLRRMLPAAVSASSLSASMNCLLPASLRRMKCFSHSDFFFDCILISGSRLQVATFSPASLDTNERCAAASAAGIRATLFSYLIGPFLSEATLIALVVDLIPDRLEKTKTPFEELSNRILRLYLRLTIQKVNWKARDRLSTTRFASYIFHSWLSLSDEDLSDGILFEIAQQFEALLSLTLPYTFSSVMLLKTSADLLLRRCLVTKLSLKHLENKPSSECLMAALIALDPIRFGPSFLQLHMEQIGKDCYVRIFDRGLLDSALCSTFECPAFEKPLQVVESLGILFDKRSRLLCSDWQDSPLTARFISALLAFTTDQNLLEKVPFSSHILLVSKILQEHRLQNHIWLHRTYQNVVLLALRLCGQKRDGVPMLSAALLECLLRVLPPMIREFFKGKAITDAASSSALSFLLLCLKEIFAVNHNFDTRQFGLELSQLFSSLIRTCLRFGIATSANDRNSVRELILQVVQPLVPLLHGEHSELSFLVTSFSKSFATHVFELMISHSKFTALLLSPSSNTERKVRLKALRLMKACLLAAEDIGFNVDLWLQLLTCYDAGTTEKDLLVREVLFLLAKCAPSGSICTALDQLRWGRNIEKPGKVGWDWLVDRLDLRRVHATLERFPVGDPRDPLFIRPDKAGDEICGSTAFDDEDECGPYSPGFLLPLVLGALEDDEELRFLERSKGSSASRLRDHSSLASKSSQYLIAQRLCDKGGLALTLVSLCSDKTAIRKLSVSILDAFMEVVGSKEAHQMPSWRERPQLALVLNAVQRSLVVRQAEDNARGTESFVPKLPGFSAIFLARASLLLSRPNDPLFVAINRAFLRTETDFGAFQDLTRIPAFVSLFCSSSNDQEQLKLERRFSLDLVRDGFTGEEMYKLLIACHCPELLLTSLESSQVCSFLQREDEAVLILQTLTKLIVLGGDQAASHLIDRMGLFPWLRSLLCGGNINVLFSSRSARNELLFLLVEVTRRASTRMSANELVAVTSGLAQSVLSMAIEMMDCTKSTRASASKANATTIEQVCEFLTLVQAFYLNSGRSTCEKCCQPDGYTAASTINEGLEQLKSHLGLPLEQVEEQQSKIQRLQQVMTQQTKCSTDSE